MDRCSRGGSGFRPQGPGRRAPATPSPSRRPRFGVAGESFPGQRRRQPNERSHRRRDREQAGSAAGAEAVVVCRDRGGTPRLHRTHHAGPRFGVAGGILPRPDRTKLPSARSSASGTKAPPACTTFPPSGAKCPGYTKPAEGHLDPTARIPEAPCDPPIRLRFLFGHPSVTLRLSFGYGSVFGLFYL